MVIEPAKPPTAVDALDKVLSITKLLPTFTTPPSPAIPPDPPSASPTATPALGLTATGTETEYLQLRHHRQHFEDKCHRHHCLL